MARATEQTCVSTREDDVLSWEGSNRRQRCRLFGELWAMETLKNQLIVRMDGEIMWFGLPSVDTDIDMRFHVLQRLSAAVPMGHR